MAENAPPTTGGSADSSRGMPYYEKLRKDLRDTLQKKRQLDANIMNLEDNIFRLETQYLEETPAGNIIKGFDNYIKGASGAPSSVGTGTSTRRKGGITDADRIFSRSSANFQRDSSDSHSNTPSHAPTPSASVQQGTQPAPVASTPRNSVSNTKKKKAPDDDSTDEKATKRGKITYGRG